MLIFNYYIKNILITIYFLALMYFLELLIINQLLLNQTLKDFFFLLITLFNFLIHLMNKYIISI